MAYPAEEQTSLREYVAVETYLTGLQDKELELKVRENSPPIPTLDKTFSLTQHYESLRKAVNPDKPLRNYRQDRPPRQYFEDGNARRTDSEPRSHPPQGRRPRFPAPNVRTMSETRSPENKETEKDKHVSELEGQIKQLQQDRDKLYKDMGKLQGLQTAREMANRAPQPNTPRPLLQNNLNRQLPGPRPNGYNNSNNNGPSPPQLFSMQ